MNKQELLDFGFRKGSLTPHLDKFDEVYWFSMKDEVGVRFHVSVLWWNFSKYSSAERGKVEDGWDFVAYLQMKKEDEFRIEKSCRHETPKDIVDWVSTVWWQLNCIYVKRFEDDK
jgi:hypothetical protein